MVCVITEHMQMAYSSEPDVLMNVNEKYEVKGKQPLETI